MQDSTMYRAGLYLRLSKDDDLNGESLSIGTQRSILVDYCQENQIEIYKIYVDDGYTGMNFSRPGFQELLQDVELGNINMVITKDLSRLGRNYILTGYYSEIFFPSKGVRYIALADQFDSLGKSNEIAPFKNILNEMYARDISVKIKNAKHQRAKQGLFIGSQAPYGYRKDPDNKNHLIIDPEAAEVVKLIFTLATTGLGNIAIATELKARGIMTPSAYKFSQGCKEYSRYPPVQKGEPCNWSYGTVGQLLTNPVYTGDLISLKSETVSCKTKQRTSVPVDRRIITPNAHEAIISKEVFFMVKQIRSDRVCLANTYRDNLFRGKLFCECCGHPLTISKKQLKERIADMYLCMYHYSHPEVCPKTHRVYHDMLYPYVLQQVTTFARSMKRRKVNSSIKDYAGIQELTPKVLDDTIERIEIGHVRYNSRPGSVIHIYWKLR